MKNIPLEQAVGLIISGGVGVMPTDTLYGLVARAADVRAVERLYAYKGREKKPGTLIAANVEQLIDLGVSEEELQEIKYLWPNPLSIVMKIKDIGHLHQGVGEIPVRVVADASVRNLLLSTGPLMTTSANTPGDPSSTTIEMAQNYFGDKVDFYVDGGDSSGREASTIIGIKNGEITVFREGAISKDQLLKLQKANEK